MRARLAHLPPIRGASASLAISKGRMNAMSPFIPTRRLPGETGAAPLHMPRSSRCCPFDVKRRRHAKRGVATERKSLIRLEPQPGKPAAQFTEDDREFHPRQLL